MNIISKIINKFNYKVKEYGADQIIRDYSRFPRFLNLPCHCEHGWTGLDMPLKSDVNINKLVVLVFSQRRKRAWKKNNKLVFVFGPPLVRYRKMNGLKVKDNAVGTIAYPSHSSQHVVSEYDIKQYCYHLKKLPSKYHPVTVCLHWHDILKGRKNLFIEEGFDVVTAGDMYSSDFPKKFYEIMTSYKYSTSNTVGSYSFYSIELGIPFFLTGPPARMINDGKDLNVPRDYEVSNLPFSKAAYKIFDKHPVDTIKIEQKKYVDSEIGESEVISRNLLLFILILMWPIDKINIFLRCFQTALERILDEFNINMYKNQ